MTRPRTPLALAGLLAFTTVLTACGPVNEGTARATEFHAHFIDEPDVIDIDLSASNTLPFAGQVTGWLTLDPEVSDARFCELVHDVGDFQSSHRTSWGITVEAGPWAMEVADDRTGNETRCERLTELRNDPALAGAILGDRTIHVAVPDADHPAAAYDTAAEIVRPDRELTVVVLRPEDRFRAEDGGWSFRVSSDREGARPDAAIDAYETLDAVVHVATANLGPTGAALVIGTFRDYDLAESTIGGLRTADFDIAIEALDVEIEGGFTPATRSLAEQLLDVEGVEHLAIGPEHVTVRVASLAAVPAVESAIAGVDTDDAVLINLRSPIGATPEWRVTGDTAARAARIAIVEAALATGVVDSISATVLTLYVELGDETDEALRELGRALRASVPDGEGVQITGEELGFRFDAAPTLTELESFRDGDPTPFLEGWNEG